MTHKVAVCQSKKIGRCSTIALVQPSSPWPGSSTTLNPSSPWAVLPALLHRSQAAPPASAGPLGTKPAEAMGCSIALQGLGGLLAEVCKGCREAMWGRQGAAAVGGAVSGEERSPLRGFAATAWAILPRRPPCSPVQDVGRRACCLGAAAVAAWA